MPSLVDLKGSGRGMERGRCNQSNHRVVLRLRLHSLLLLLIKNCDSFGPQKVVDCQQQARKSGRGINWRVSAAVRKVIIIRQAVLTRHTRTRPHWIRPHTVRGIGNEEEGGGEFSRSEGIMVIHLPSLDNGCSGCRACSMLKPAKKPE